MVPYCYKLIFPFVFIISQVFLGLLFCLMFIFFSVLVLIQIYYLSEANIITLIFFTLVNSQDPYSFTQCTNIYEMNFIHNISILLIIINIKVNPFWNSALSLNDVSYLVARSKPYVCLEIITNNYISYHSKLKKTQGRIHYNEIDGRVTLIITMKKLDFRTASFYCTISIKNIN